MIYETSLSDVIKIFMAVTIMTSQDTNRFHNNSTVKNVNIFFYNPSEPNFQKIHRFHF